MVSDTKKTAAEQLVAQFSEEQLQALVDAMAARKAENHPVLVAERTYSEAMRVGPEVTVEGMEGIIVALDTLVATQGALSTTQLTAILRKVLVHLSS